MQGAGWTKVYSKRPGFKWDVFPFGGRNRGPGLAAVTSFFVSEFPDFVNAKNLFEIFGCSGRIVEVAISPRKTRFGKRFAFARFLDVVDGRALAIRLDNIMFEGKKIHVNLPRFNRAQEVGAGKIARSSSNGKPVNPPYGGILGKFSGSVKGGNKTTYAEVVALKGSTRAHSKEDVAWLNFQSDQTLKSRFDRAFVGRVCILGSAYNIQTHFEMEGIFSIKVTPIGGNCCLLEELEVGFIGDLIKEGESWWRSWFASLEKWELGKVDGCRDVWLRIFGVPLHVWSSDFFVALGEKWGRFVCIDDNTAKGEAFDVARVLVNIPITLIIPEFVNVDIDGAMFKLRIREDTQCAYRPVTGFRKEASSDGSSSDSDSEIPLLSDSDASSKSKDKVVCRDGRDGNRKSDVEAPILSPVGTLTGGRVNGFKGTVEDVTGGIGKQSVDLLCRSGFGVLGSNTGIVHRGETVNVVSSDSSSALRECKAKHLSNSSKTSRSKGCSASGSRDVVGSEFVVGDTTAVVHSPNLSYTVKGNLFAGQAAPRCNPKDINNEDGLDREYAENSVHVSAGTEKASDDNILNPVSPCSSLKDVNRVQLVKPARNPEFNVEMDQTGDSIESDAADSRYYQTHPLRVGSGSDESIFPDTEGSNLKLVNFDCDRLNADGIDLSTSLSSVAPNVIIGKVSSSKGGGLDDFIVNNGCRNLLPGNLADPTGSNNFVYPERGHAVPVQLESTDSSSKKLSGTVIKGRSEGKKIKRVILNGSFLSKGKGEQISKYPSELKVKGFYPCENSAGRENSNSGDHLHCYGEQSEDSDICRNNNRQWEFLKRDVGERLWEAMLALGVVDLERSQSLHMVEVSGSGGRKDVNNFDQ